MNNTALSAEKTKKENIIFISDAHEKFYFEKMKEVRYQDVYHKALIYCLGRSNDTRRNIECIYDFKSGCVKTECLHDGWQTSGSAKVVRMAFNLYCNGITSVVSMTVCFVVTMAVSLVRCKLAGIWIGFLRFLLGTALGISVGTSIALFFSACLGLMCAAGLSDNDTSSISFRTGDGTYVHLIPSGSSGHYYDADTHEVYRLLNDNWVINDRTGESFPIG